MPWNAIYPGLCADCGEPFTIGTLIERAPLPSTAFGDLTVHYRHAGGCPDDPPNLLPHIAPDEQLCDVCGTYHRGAC